MTGFLAGLAALVLGAIARLGLPGRVGRVAWLVLAVAGAALASRPAFEVVAGSPAIEWRFATTLPGGDWLLRIDPLAAWFVPIILLVGAVALIFGAGAVGEAWRSPRVAFTEAMMSILLVAMALVVTAQAVVPLLVAWELMAIAGLLLILHDGERPEVRQSALVYLVVTHAATLALMAMFALWGSASADLTFPSLAASAAARPAWRATLLLLGLLGFGLKAGVVPLHSWLPGAHASAPSHVSAVLSGVMIKTGIYGLLRLTLLVGNAPAWWGWLLLVAGLGSGVLGVLWALAQHDLKRLLAYHSVENIGIILIGLGAGVLGTAHHQPLLAVLGYAGALLHTLNHSLFKSLLFLGSGAIARATGTRQIDALGGLGRRMPWTWATFLIGSVAIVGLPPLNGFVSEWTIALALLAGLHGPTATRVLPLALAGLGLIGALALACFTKIDGVMFLGQPRTREAAGAREVSAWLRAPLAVLAAACVILGLVPTLALAPALRTSVAMLGDPGAAAALGGATSFGPGLDAVLRGATRVAWLGAALIATFLAAAWLRRRRLPHGATVGDTWACGYSETTPRMQYTADSYATPLLGAFGALSGVTTERTARSFRTHSVDLILDRAARPLWNRLQETAAQLRWMQSGRLHWYLLYVLATLALLLTYLAARAIR